MTKHDPRAIQVHGTPRFIFSLLDLYPRQFREAMIAKDAADEIINNQESTTRRIARWRLSAIAGVPVR